MKRLLIALDFLMCSVVDNGKQFFIYLVHTNELKYPSVTKYQENSRIIIF